jgi:MFS family permease
MTALAWSALQLTGSATAVGVLLIASSVPGLIFVLIGGAAADRYSRRGIMLFSDAARALTLGMVAALGFANALQFWHLIALSIIFGFVRGFFYPAYQAVITELVETDQLRSANGLTGLSMQAGTLVGPLLGAWLVSAASANIAFAFDALTFFAAAHCVLPTGKLRGPAASAAGRNRRGLGSVIAESREGMRYILGSSWLVATIVLPFISNPLLGAAFSVALPTLIRDVWRQGAWLYGLEATAAAIGAIVGMLIFSRVKPKRRGVACFAMSLISAVTLLAFALPIAPFWQPTLVCGVGVVVGFMSESFNLIWLTTVQELVPSDKLGRVFSLDQLGSLALVPIGYALAGAISDRTNPILVFVLAGAIKIGTSLVGLSLRGVRDLR